jgi:hypothetical protein
MSSLVGGPAPGGTPQPFEVEAVHRDGTPGRVVVSRNTHLVEAPDGDPAALRLVAAALREMAGVLGDCGDRCDAAVQALINPLAGGAGWSGPAADAFSAMWSREFTGVWTYGPFPTPSPGGDGGGPGLRLVKARESCLNLADFVDGYAGSLEKAIAEFKAYVVANQAELISMNAGLALVALAELVPVVGQVVGAVGGLFGGGVLAALAAETTGLIAWLATQVGLLLQGVVLFCVQALVFTAGTEYSRQVLTNLQLNGQPIGRAATDIDWTRVEGAAWHAAADAAAVAPALLAGPAGPLALAAAFFDVTAVVGYTDQYLTAQAEHPGEDPRGYMNDGQVLVDAGLAGLAAGAFGLLGPGTPAQSPAEPEPVVFTRGDGSTLFEGVLNPTERTVTGTGVHAGSTAHIDPDTRGLVITPTDPTPPPETTEPDLVPVVGGDAVEYPRGSYRITLPNRSLPTQPPTVDAEPATTTDSAARAPSDTARTSGSDPTRGLANRDNVSTTAAPKPEPAPHTELAEPVEAGASRAPAGPALADQDSTDHHESSAAVPQPDSAAVSPTAVLSAAESTPAVVEPEVADPVGTAHDRTQTPSNHALAPAAIPTSAAEPPARLRTTPAAPGAAMTDTGTGTPTASLPPPVSAVNAVALTIADRIATLVPDLTTLHAHATPATAAAFTGYLRQWLTANGAGLTTATALAAILPTFTLPATHTTVAMTLDPERYRLYQRLLGAALDEPLVLPEHTEGLGHFEPQNLAAGADEPGKPEDTPSAGQTPAPATGHTEAAHHAPVAGDSPASSSGQPAAGVPEHLAARTFAGESAEAMRQEVYDLAVELGFREDEVLVRIFDAGLADLVRRYGTDRAGLDELDTRSYRSDDTFGYHGWLREHGLRLDDGLYAIRLSEWADFAEGLFERDILGIEAHRAAIALYRDDLFQEVPDEYGWTGEFFALRDPALKLDALVGLLTQQPTELDAAFWSIDPTDLATRIEFVRALLPDFDARLHEIRPLVKDLIREAQRVLHQATAAGHDTTGLNDDIHAAQDIEQFIDRRSIELAQLDEIDRQVQMLHDAGVIRTRATSVDFLRGWIDQELAEETATDRYATELNERAAQLDQLVRELTPRGDDLAPARGSVDAADQAPDTVVASANPANSSSQPAAGAPKQLVARAFAGDSAEAKRQDVDNLAAELGHREGGNTQPWHKPTTPSPSHQTNPEYVRYVVLGKLQQYREAGLYLSADVERFLAHPDPSDNTGLHRALQAMRRAIEHDATVALVDAVMRQVPDDEQLAEWIDRQLNQFRLDHPEDVDAALVREWIAATRLMRRWYDDPELEERYRAAEEAGWPGGPPVNNDPRFDVLASEVPAELDPRAVMVARVAARPERAFSTADWFALQIAINRVFGVGGEGLARMLADADDDWVAAARRIDAEDGVAFDAIVRAMHELTQELFRDLGMTHVRLHRGWRFRRDVPPEFEGDAATLEMALHQHPASSWATESETATGFAAWGGAEAQTVLTSAEYPVERIFATPFTGGRLSFMPTEVLALDGDGLVRADIRTETDAPAAAINTSGVPTARALMVLDSGALAAPYTGIGVKSELVVRAGPGEVSADIRTAEDPPVSPTNLLGVSESGAVVVPDSTGDLASDQPATSSATSSPTQPVVDEPVALRAEVAPDEESPGTEIDAPSPAPAAHGGQPVPVHGEVPAALSDHIESTPAPLAALKNNRLPPSDSTSASITSLQQHGVHAVTDLPESPQTTRISPSSTVPDWWGDPGFRSTPKDRQQMREQWDAMLQAFSPKTAWSAKRPPLGRLRSDHPWLSSVPDEDLIAVASYTADSTIFNDTLWRSHSDPENPDWHALITLQGPVLRCLVSGVNQFPIFEGAAYRAAYGLRPDEYEVGARPWLPAFTSATTSLDWARSLARWRDSRVVLQINSKTGRLIEDGSVNPELHEVLFKPYIDVEVVEHVTDPDGTKRIVMEER